VSWIRAGKLKYREDVREGIEAAPGLIRTLYDGGNAGKLLIRLRDEHAPAEGGKS
jgi:NADPH-dependent curcumin reductase CurA